MRSSLPEGRERRRSRAARTRAFLIRPRALFKQRRARANGNATSGHGSPLCRPLFALLSEHETAISGYLLADFAIAWQPRAGRASRGLAAAGLLRACRRAGELQQGGVAAFHRAVGAQHPRAQAGGRAEAAVAASQRAR